MNATTPEIARLASDLLSDFNNNQECLEDNILYYESRRRPTAIGMATPPEMKKLDCRIGWCRVYLDSLEERLDIEGFRLAGKAQGESIGDERLWSWWQYNNLDEWSGLGHLEAMIHGRAYITISAPDPGDPLMDPTKPIIRVESATSMWADVDPRTHRVTRAIRVVQDADGSEDPDRLTLYLPNSTIGLVRSTGMSMVEWDEEWRVDHNLGIVPVVPLLNRARLTEWYGKSEITPELKSAIDGASRIMMNMQAAAELMAIPQRLLIGMSKEELLGTGSDAKSTFEAYVARILALPEGVVGHQFSAAELRNFAEGMEMFAKEAAKITGLPAHYLAFQSENPTSADAIRASETRLVKKSERKQRVFGGVWEQVMRIAMLIMDGGLPVEAHRLETLWRDPATPTFAAMADALTKLVAVQTASGVQLVPNEQARIELGYSVEDRRQMKIWDRESPRQKLSDVLTPSFSDQDEGDEAR
jgi:SPP1 Gp6-like portal protein